MIGMLVRSDERHERKAEAASDATKERKQLITATKRLVMHVTDRINKGRFVFSFFCIWKCIGFNEPLLRLAHYLGG